MLNACGVREQPHEPSPYLEAKKGKQSGESVTKSKEEHASVMRAMLTFTFGLMLFLRFYNSAVLVYNKPFKNGCVDIIF